MLIRNTSGGPKCFSALFLISGFVFSAMGLTAPYLFGVQATGSQSISISWRNNDLNTTEFIVLRKTSSTPFAAVDSIPFPATAFNDSNLAPSTKYFYAVLSSAQGQLSDTSNIDSAVTTAAPIIFVAPQIAVSWNPITKTDSITYYDSSTGEKGYRLFRRMGAGKFSLIDSQISASPWATGLKYFIDPGISPNIWYTYKVEVFDNSDSLFSSDSAIYTYAEPQKTHSYSFTKISEFPIAPIGWSEKIGDSLYVNENDINSPHAITVINIKDRANPAFLGYLRADSLPAVLQHTKIADYIKFNVKNNPPWARTYFSANGFDFVFREDTLFQYSAATQGLISTIVFNDGSWHNGIIAQLNDSLLLLNIGFGINRLCTCKYSNKKMDTLFSEPMDDFSTLSGFQNQKAYFISVFFWGHMDDMMSVNFSFYDYGINQISPQHFEGGSSWDLNSCSACLIDSFISFRYSVYNSLLTIETFDIRSAQSNSLSSFVDSNFKGGAINNIIIDSTTNEIFMVGANSFAVYQYSQGPAAIKMNGLSLQNKNKSLLTAYITQNGILIKFGVQRDPIEGLSIYNVAGRMVRNFSGSVCSATQGLLWDGRDNRGAALSPGSYFLALKGAKPTESIRVFLMHK